MTVRGNKSYGINALRDFVDGFSPASVAHPVLIGTNACSALAELGTKSKKGDWQSIERLLQAQSDLQSRDMLIESLTRAITGRPSWLDAWVQQRPTDYLPLLFRGYQAVTWAWEARGNKRAQHTSRKRFDGFFERLRTAQVDLEEAARRAPDRDAGALAFQITLARGLQYPKPDLLALYEKVQQRSPNHPVAVWAMIQGMAPKWGGTLPAMFSVAREAAVKSQDVV